MGALKPILVVGALVVSAPLQADEPGRWQPFIAEASARFGLPTDWIDRVIRAESGGRTRLNGAPIRSPKGAMGLMQLMPGTWAEMRERLQLGTDPDDPRDNILAGTFYLRLMFDRFGYPGLFGAYNAGPARYSEYLAGRPLPPETQRYLQDLAGGGGREPRAHPPKLFLIDRTPARSAGRVARNPLFAVRHDEH